MIRDMRRDDNMTARLGRAYGMTPERLLESIALHFPDDVTGRIAWAELKRREGLESDDGAEVSK